MLFQKLVRLDDPPKPVRRFLSHAWIVFESIRMPNPRQDPIRVRDLLASRVNSELELAEAVGSGLDRKGLGLTTEVSLPVSAVRG